MKVDAKDRKAVEAGPFTTAPAVVNLEPWHGQTYWDASKPLTVHASWVQVAVNTVKAVSLVRDTRKAPMDELINAAVPAEASAPDEGIVTETTRPETAPLMVESWGTLPGDVGLPPHAPINVPAATTDAVWQARAQN